MQIPKSMCGWVLTGHGGPERLAWREDLPVPSPSAGEVLIRVKASAVNNTDINTRTGWYSKRVRGSTSSGSERGHGEDVGQDGSWSGEPLAFPRIQGADCCGEIVAVGQGVSGRRIGERVLVRVLQTVDAENEGPSTITFGSERDGAFAEYTTANADDALAVESGLDDVELASFPCAFSTAEGMIQRAGIGAERVLITGASGGVGLAAVQLATRRGARITALTRSDKAEAVRALGAVEALDRDAAIPADSFDAIVDVVGGARWPAWIDALRPGGRYVTAGAIGGPMVELDLRTLYLRDLSLFGCTHQPNGVFEDLVGYIEAEELTPVVAERFPLRELHAAQSAFQSKALVGKVGITIDPS